MIISPTMKSTNYLGETAIIKEVLNPVYFGGYSGCVGVAGSLSQKYTTSVSFEGLKGKSKKYVENAGLFSFFLLLHTAQKMILENLSFEEAATYFIKKEFQTLKNRSQK